MFHHKRIIGTIIWFFPFILSFVLQFFGTLDHIEELIVYQHYKNINPNHKFSDKIVIVAIDNDSLMHFAQHPDFGRWPWKRSVYLPVLQFIEKYNPKIILFDLLFSEPSKDDSKLVQFNKESSVISHTLFLQKGELNNTQTIPEMYFKKHSIRVEEKRNNCNIGFNTIIFPSNQIGLTAPSLHAVGEKELGGRLDKDDLLIYKYKNYYFPSLPIVAYNSINKILHLKMSSSELKIKTGTGLTTIPLKDCYYSLHYYSFEETKNIPIVPFYKFNNLFFDDKTVHHNFDATFRDKIVLIGTTATSIYDEKITPYGNLQNLLLNATTISNLLENHFLTRVPIWVNIVLGFFLTLIGLYSMFFVGGNYRRAIVSFSVLLIYMLFAIWMFKYDISFNLSFFVTSYPISFVFSLWYISFLEGKENAKLLKETIELNKQLKAFNEKAEELVKKRTAQLEEEKKLTEKIMIELQERNEIIEREQKKAEELLQNILPPEVAEELKLKGEVQPVYYNSVSVLFADLKGFTKAAETMTVEELVRELDVCFFYFDEVTKKHNLEKIKTIGDAYMCAGGLPKENKTHVIDACLAALEIQHTMQQAKEVRIIMNLPYWELRLGIHVGPVAAGVVGKHKFAYDIWGDTVNIASRMESSGEAGRVNISGYTYKLMRFFFECEYRGKVKAKNKGEIDMYFLLRLKSKFSRDVEGRVPNENFQLIYERIKNGKNKVKLL
ncbi:MAG: CHASE2 domain-containing protein [Leptospiraceae bacterium]|nr:CHASE2 domain-containing protein [Leptospiraceae bacterium]